MIHISDKVIEDATTRHENPARSQIQAIVGNIHLGKPDTFIVREIWDRCKIAGATRDQRRAAIAWALKVRRQHQSLAAFRTRSIRRRASVRRERWAV
jgi:hypothetical protein